jgi:hypothetical protein
MTTTDRQQQQQPRQQLGGLHTLLSMAHQRVFTASVQKAPPQPLPAAICDTGSNPVGPLLFGATVVLTSGFDP